MHIQTDTERVFLQPCFVLHYRPYKNTSLIVELFSQEYGRIALVAKGVQQKNSKLRGVLQPFQKILVSWIRKGELGTLTHAEISITPEALNQDAMYAGLYLNEVLMRLLEKHDALPALFTAYLDALNEININSKLSSVLREFEKELLKSLGFELQLSIDANAEAILEDRYYRYIPEHGFIETTRSDTQSFKGEFLLAIERKEYYSQDVLKTARVLMQINLSPLIGDKPLKSRELYRAYKSL